MTKHSGVGGGETSGRSRHRGRLLVALGLVMSACLGITPTTAEAGTGTLRDLVIPGPGEAVAITAGSSHTCALLTTGSVRCWGSNDAGQLGDGTTTDSSVPVTVLGINGATAITAGVAHTCALRGSDGTIRCWGRNDDGQLGNGTTTSSLGRVAVSGVAGASAIAAGEEHTCALKGSDGTVRCWGLNAQGQLGNGTTTNSSTRVMVTGVSGATAITADGYHSCARHSSATLRCWGFNGGGQLGDGTTTNSPTRVTVTGMSDAGAPDAGDWHTCAPVSTDGSVRCWGSGGFGRLGNGTTANSPTPVTVTGLSGATAVSAGYGHTCALRGSDGTVRCWGWNIYGQLGDGGTTDSSTRVTVTGIAGASQLATGDVHTCALRGSDGSVRCWGNNSRGQLGDGTMTDSPTRVLVEDL